MVAQEVERDWSGIGYDVRSVSLLYEANAYFHYGCPPDARGDGISVFRSHQDNWVSSDFLSALFHLSHIILISSLSIFFY